MVRCQPGLETLLLASCLILWTARVGAEPGSSFGAGLRDMALARSDVASPATCQAARVNPAAVANRGASVCLTGNLSTVHLQIDGRSVSDGATSPSAALGWHDGTDLSARWSVGVGLLANAPVDSAASSSFRPASEPVFLRLEPGQEASTLHTAIGLRWRSLSLGLGAALYMSASSTGRALMDQDVTGAHADGSLDARAHVHLAPSLGLLWRSSAVSVGLALSDERKTRISARMLATVNVDGNPLNGDTKFLARGSSGYVPARASLGASWRFAQTWTATLAAGLSRWSQAPTQYAHTTWNLRLGVTPDIFPPEEESNEPKDTWSVHGGLTGPVPWSAGHARWLVGGAYSTSALGPARGWSTVIDSDEVVGSGAVTVDLGRHAEVTWKIGLGGTAVWILRTTFSKPDPTLPFARGTAAGTAVRGALEVEATW